MKYNEVYFKKVKNSIEKLWFPFSERIEGGGLNFHMYFRGYLIDTKCFRNMFGLVPWLLDEMPPSLLLFSTQGLKYATFISFFVVSELGIPCMTKYQTSIFNTGRHQVIRKGLSKQEPRTLMKKRLDRCPFVRYPIPGTNKLGKERRKTTHPTAFACHNLRSRPCAT